MANSAEFVLQQIVAAAEVCGPRPLHLSYCGLFSQESLCTRSATSGSGRRPAPAAARRSSDSATRAGSPRRPSQSRPRARARPPLSAGPRSWWQSDQHLKHLKLFQPVTFVLR